MKEKIYNIIAHSGIWVLDKLFPEYFGVEPMKPTDRYVEYPWALSAISQFDRMSKILDIGCSGSMFPLILDSIGMDAYGIDIRDNPTKDGFNFIKGDICDCNFEKNTFRIITAISTIEHIGLKRYGAGKHSDFSAINEIHRILRPDGLFLMTVPFGDKYTEEKFHRIYDKDRLKDLLKDFIFTYQIVQSPEANYQIALIQAVK